MLAFMLPSLSRTMRVRFLPGPRVSYGFALHFGPVGASFKP